jgi:hypothetical protein
MSEERHCDDYIDDLEAPECLREFLKFMRAPAVQRLGGESPKLFATYKEPDGSGGRKGRTRRVRVVMASRMGDVGITPNLKLENGYEWRVAVSDLKDFSDKE